MGAAGQGRFWKIQSDSVFFTLVPTFLLPSKELLEILHGERFIATETVKTVEINCLAEGKAMEIHTGARIYVLGALHLCP